MPMHDQVQCIFIWVPRRILYIMDLGLILSPHPIPCLPPCRHIYMWFTFPLLTVVFQIGDLKGLVDKRTVRRDRC